MGTTHHDAGRASTAVRPGAGSAHGKAILLGEHAVVYGAPAIAIPIDELTAHVDVAPSTGGLRIESALYTGPLADAPARLAPVSAAIAEACSRLGAPDLQGLAALVRIDSMIPHERGLGSSAAVAAALVRALYDAASADLDAGTLFELIQTSERAAHGSPSGIDARTVTSPVPIRFTRGEAAPIRIGAPLHVAFADSGSSGSTTRAVGVVRALREREPVRTETLLTRLAQVSEGSVADLESGDRSALGARMREAHDILRRVGVSSPELDALVSAARAAGSPGAKLTGGGMGGCVIAIADSPAHAVDLSAALRRAGAHNTWTVEVPAA